MNCSAVLDRQPHDHTERRMVLTVQDKDEVVGLRSLPSPCDCDSTANARRLASWAERQEHRGSVGECGSAVCLSAAARGEGGESIRTTRSSRGSGERMGGVEGLRRGDRRMAHAPLLALFCLVCLVTTRSLEVPAARAGKVGVAEEGGRNEIAHVRFGAGRVPDEASLQ